jgi:hypothetical protein
MKKFERGLEESLSMDIQIPQDGSEDEAIRGVKRQLESSGMPVSDSEVRERVRDACKGLTARRPQADSARHPESR